MLNFNFLADETTAANPNSNLFLWILLGFMVLFLVYSFISGNKRRKKMAEEQEKRNDIHPGYKVTTIGGIVGVVEEVDNDANTFVLRTGTEDNPSYIKFDKQAIYLSENPLEKTAEEPVKDEEEVFGDKTEEKPEEAVSEEKSAEKAE